MHIIASQSNHAYIGEVVDRDGDAVTLKDAYQVSHPHGSRINEAWVATEGIGEPRSMCVFPRMASVLIFGVTSIIGIGREVEVKICATLRDLEEHRRIQNEQ